MCRWGMQTQKSRHFFQTADLLGSCTQQARQHQQRAVLLCVDGDTALDALVPSWIGTFKGEIEEVGMVEVKPSTPVGH